MNSRERFLKIMKFENCDRTMLWEVGYWAGTVRLWYQEGLLEIEGIPEYVDDGVTVTGEGIPSPEVRCPVDEDVHKTFNFDKRLIRIPVELGIYPPFELKVLEDYGETQLVSTEWGATKKVRKDGRSMPQFSTFLVNNRNDFDKIKKYFNPDDPGRFPPNWDSLCSEYKNRDYPLAIGGYPYGLFGYPRFLMGLENLLFSYYDDPEFINNLLEFLTDFWISIWDKVLSQVEADYALIWEDMCYKNGPLISPDLFRKFMMPQYRRITKFFRDKGVDIICVDTDGDCTELIPLFMECGFTAMVPFEVQAGMNIIEVRKNFPKLGIMGGLDKRAIALGKEEIDMELESKLPFMLSKGGYIPCADHLIPPDVSWNNFKYYRNRLEQIVRQLKIKG
jgi:uroporphyrinogen decarboxylase